MRTERATQGAISVARCRNSSARLGFEDTLFQAAYKRRGNMGDKESRPKDAISRVYEYFLGR